MKDAVLVLGYNNTRINDVKKIREKVKLCLNAMTLLCKKDPNETDKSAVDLVIDVGLEKTDENLKIINDFCTANEIRLVGILPFSDHGTQLGAKLAHSLNLPGANPHEVNSALNKHNFREKEKQAKQPNGYIPVNAMKITTLNELQFAFKTFDSAIFVKPMTEGNSRGCIAIKNYADCEPAWDEVKKYLSGGITAERLIEHAQEYSWEYVAGYSWITEKLTTQNQYRAEPQHILPAPIKENEETLLSNGAKFMAELCGYNGCACHNEIFLLDTKDRVMAVEPNLRPAGGKLWDLSTHAFEDFDPWTLWILWSAGKIDSTPKVLKQKCFAGMRFLTAKKNGSLKSIGFYALDKLTTRFSGDFIELVWTKKPGDTVVSSPRDNSDFLGYITAKSSDYKNLAALLLQVEELLTSECIIEKQ